jgi:hypothetical protein
MSRTSLSVIKRNLKMLEGQAKLEEDVTILAIIKNIDKELENHRADFPKQLIHFLEKRSYQKALQFLEKGELYEET